MFKNTSLKSPFLLIVLALVSSCSPKLTVKSGIEAALKRRAQTDAQNITVEAFGDRVTLAGTVHSWSERDLAERSAWGAPGVRSVINNMTIA